MAKIFTASKMSGKGNGSSVITPSIWNGRLEHVETVTGTTADAPKPSDVTTLIMEGLGNRTILTEVFIGTSSVGKGGQDNVSDLVIPAAGVDVRVTFKTNLDGIGISSITGAILGTQNLVCKIKRVVDTAYKYLKNDGMLSDTPAQLSNNFAVGSVHPISGDPGATDFYLVDLTFRVPENVMAENRKWGLTIGTLTPGGFSIGGSQTGAAPKITLSPATLRFTPSNLAGKTITITSNDDWTLTIN